MSKLAGVLRDEIRRAARREARARVAPLQATVRELRRDVRRLTRSSQALERALHQVAPARSGLSVPAPEVAAKARLSPGLIGKLRQRLGLTLEEFAILLEASAGSVFNWEHARSRPNRAMRARLVAMRQLGRRGARRLLKDRVRTSAPPPARS